MNESSDDDERPLKMSKSISRKKERSPPNITWKHVWSSDETQDAVSNSPFCRMPTEVIFEIFRLLSVRDLGNVSLVCRLLKMIADQDDIWKTKCNISKKLNSKTFKQIYIDWIYEKYLRNEELERVEQRYKRVRYACGKRRSPPQFPLRPEGKQQFLPLVGFDQHPNSSSNMIIKLSVDIDKTAPELISLLEKASKFQDEWRQSAILQQMIQRYYRFLQLKVLYPKNLLIPTLDIEIIWQTHLLRPTMYRDDCLRLFHQIIDHSLLTNDIEQFLKNAAFIDTCQLYEQRFGEQYCSLPSNKTKSPIYVHPRFSQLQCLIPVYSYWDETYFQFSSNPPNSYENPFSFTEADVILDGNWLNLCKQFMSKMLSKMDDNIASFYSPDSISLKPAALKRLKKSYERFLYMTAKYPSNDQHDFIHPTYAIDIIWHSHMQEPLNYTNDCNRFVGYLIDHTPWPSIEKNQIKQSCDDVNRYWKKEFQSDMSTDHLYNTVDNDYDN